MAKDFPDLEAYCVRCGSDKHTELSELKHPSMRWCNLCWKWQKPIPTSLLSYIRELEEQRSCDG